MVFIPPWVSIVPELSCDKVGPLTPVLLSNPDLADSVTDPVVWLLLPPDTVGMLCEPGVVELDATRAGLAVLLLKPEELPRVLDEVDEVKTPVTCWLAVED